MRIILLSLIAGANEVVQIHNFSETLSINDSQNIFHSHELNKIVFTMSFTCTCGPWHFSQVGVKVFFGKIVYYFTTLNCSCSLLLRYGKIDRTPLRRWKLKSIPKPNTNLQQRKGWGGGGVGRSTFLLGADLKLSGEGVFNGIYYCPLGSRATCTCMPLCTGLVILTPWLRTSNLSIVNSILFHNTQLLTLIVIKIWEN